jgi:CHASE2 domain-containing sensor protein
MLARASNGSSNQDLDSFALQVVAAYEKVAYVPARTQDHPTIRQANDTNDFVYGGFIRPDQFPSLSARLLTTPGDLSKDKCRNRIVIIGGTWHRDAENAGPLIEEYESPIGTIPGLYFQANYVEALLDRRFAPPVQPWVGLLVDVLLVVLLYGALHLGGLVARPFWRAMVRLLVISVFISAIAVGYVFLAFLGLYLDSVMAVAACFIHLPAVLVFKRLFPEGTSQDGSASSVS